MSTVKPKRAGPRKKLMPAKKTPAAQGRAPAHEASPEVRVVWRELPATPFEREEHVRQIAATVLGHMQRSVSAPVLPLPGLASPGDAEQLAAQTRIPLSYVEGKQRITSIQISDVDGVVRAVMDDGQVIELKTAVRKPGPGTVGAMDELLRPRRPMKVNRRPGNGGLQRSRNGDAIDPTEGLDQYGEITWWSVQEGASVGLLEMNPAGTAVVLCRLSSEEKNDRLVDQLRPCLALAKQYGLEVRMVIFAVKMSGKREVRAERAGAPPADVLEREDILELDKYIHAGWVEHIIARGGDRIARDILPGETLLRRWADNHIALWLSDFGRKMNYSTDPGDRMLVRMMMMISAEEREAIVARTQRGALNKGPLAGNGHLGPTRFGFIRDKKTYRLSEDPDQWPWILRMFELADAGTCLNGDALSTRAIADQLAAEGCPFDHDRVRAIIKDPIYATGEFTTFVRGIEIAQTPIPLQKPVPVNRFMRVQELLALRKGRSNKTPLGEFLFNYVAAFHNQCMGLESKRGPAIVKGYIVTGQSDDLRNYRHGYWVPECCRHEGRGHGGAFVWNRDMLERPVVEAIRELATHPELLRQLQSAARHTVADSSARLTAPQRVTIEHEIAELRDRQDQAIDSWIDRTTSGSHDLDGYRALMSKFEQKIQTLERRLEMDDKARQAQATSPSPVHERRVDAFLEIMTIETPSDPFMRQVRARLFQRIVSRIVIDDSGTGPITVTVEGHLVPEGSPLEAGNPVLASEELLDSYIDRGAGKKHHSEKLLEQVRQIETDLSERADKSVSMSSLTAGLVLNFPPTESIRAAVRKNLESDTWRMRHEHARATGEPAWQMAFEFEL